MTELSVTKPYQRRRRFSREFKAEIVAKCLEPGASVSRISLATEPLDMRAGPDKALARVIQVFGSARPHCAYLFANKRGNRMKVLIHDGLGIWLCARRLNRGKFHWGETWRGDQLRLTQEQLSALVQGLPWQRLGADGVISIL
jgi:transposase